MFLAAALSVCLLLFGSLPVTHATHEVGVSSVLVESMHFSTSPYLSGFLCGLYGSATSTPADPPLANDTSSAFPLGLNVKLSVHYLRLKGMDQDGFPTIAVSFPGDKIFAGRVLSGLTSDEGSALFDLQSASTAAASGNVSRLSFQADAVTQFYAAVDYVTSQTNLRTIVTVASADDLPSASLDAIDEVVTKLNHIGYAASRVSTAEVGSTLSNAACIMLAKTIGKADLPAANVLLIPSWLQVKLLLEGLPNTGAVIFLSSVPYLSSWRPDTPPSCTNANAAREELASPLTSYAPPFFASLEYNSEMSRVFPGITINADRDSLDEATYYPLFLGYVDALIFTNAVRRGEYHKQIWGQTYSLGDDWQVGPFSSPCAADESSDDVLSCGMANGVHTMYYLSVTSCGSSQTGTPTHQTKLLAHTFTFPFLQAVPLLQDLTNTRLHVFVDAAAFPSNVNTVAFEGLAVHPVPHDYLSTSEMNATDAESDAFVALGLAVEPEDIAKRPNCIFVDPVHDGVIETENVFYLASTVEQEITGLVEVAKSLYTGHPFYVIGHTNRTLSAQTQLSAAEVSKSIVQVSSVACRSLPALTPSRTAQTPVYMIVGDSSAPADINECLRTLSQVDTAQIMMTTSALSSAYTHFSDTNAWQPSEAQRVLFVTSVRNWTAEGPIASIATELQTHRKGGTPLTPSEAQTLTSLSQLASIVRKAGTGLAPTELVAAMYDQQPSQDGIELGYLVRVADDSDTMKYWNAIAPSLTVSERTTFLRSTMTSSAEPTLCSATISTSARYYPLGTNFSDVPPTPTDSPGTTLIPGTTSTPEPTWSGSGGLSDGAIAAIVVASMVVAAAGIALVVFFCCMYTGNTRNNANAPKDGGKPIAIAFTDIQNSTALWSSIPSAMSSAVAAHHKIVRRLIVKHKCYEVKTIGDSFMIAANHPFALVQIARDLQIQLQRHNWGTSVFSDVYGALAADPGKGAGKATDVRGNAFNGLRVRVGMHIGFVNVSYDETTKGYDYYGDAVNTASRTEGLAAGGQVIMTEAVYDALTESERKSITVRPLGAQTLRGVSAPVEMLELAVLTTRHFDSLASASDACDGSGKAKLYAEGTAEGTHDSTGRDTRAASAKTASDVLGVHFAPYSTDAQIKMLREALKKFGITPPKRSQFRDDDAYVARLFSLAVKRTTDIVEFRRLLTTPALEACSEWVPPSSRRRPNPLSDSGDACVAVEVNPVDGHVVRREPRQPPPSRGPNTAVFADIEMEDVEKAPATQRPLSPVSLQNKFGFKNGTPQVEFDEAVRCFDVAGDGMLFRLFDSSASRWAFYNDTLDLVMTVTCSLGRRSCVSVLGNTRISFDETSQHHVCKLVVPPLSTELFVEGNMNGFKFQYSAMGA